MLVEWIMRHVGPPRMAGFRPRLRGSSIYVLVVGLLIAFTWIIESTSRAGESALEQRFVDRGALAARFVGTYLHGLALVERRQAVDHLGQPATSRDAFNRVVNDQQFKAAVLLDASGRALQVWPPAPKLIGINLASRYVHLRIATRGGVGVSNVVPSAARHVPIVAIAVPYASPAGRRVISGAFTLQSTPLALRLRLPRSC
jgi:hypothetical protein